MAETRRPPSESKDKTDKIDKGKTMPLGAMAPSSKPSTKESTPPKSSRWEEPSMHQTVKLDQETNTNTNTNTSVAPRSAGKSIELFVIDETQLRGGERKPWRAAEVWTKRRVYGLDSTFKCVEILDRETGKPETTNEMLGARLGGGRLREKDTVRFSYPYPLPGMEAMFMKGKKHGYTSAVERMIVRIRVLHTSADEQAPSWDEIASRWSEYPPSK